MNDHSKENNAADTDEQGIPCSDSDTMEFNQSSVNDNILKRIKEARSLLRTIQISTLNYLKPILKCREGKPDSAFCSLLNLISQDEQLKNLFTVEYSWIRRCETCTTPIVRNYKKTIITLSRVRSFFPCSPISLCICPVCKSPDQTVHLEYITLPQCFIFHFENGAGNGQFQTTAMDFEIKNRKYRLSGLITLHHGKNAAMNHFVTWIRDKDTEYWLQCNDLIRDFVIFYPKPLVIDLTEIYILMYEALDDKGTIRNKILDTNSNVTAENAEDIPFIDISEEDSLKCETGVESEKCFSISQKNELEKISEKVTALENAHEENITKNLKDQSCIIQNNNNLSFADCFDIKESPFSLKKENIIMQDFSSRSLDSKNDSENVLCEYSSIEDQSEKMTTAISQNNPNYNLTNPVLENDATFVKEIMPVKECCLKDSNTSGEIKTKKNNLNKVSSKKIVSENENETSVNSPGKIVCRPKKAETSQILENRTSVEIFSIDSKTNQPSKDLVPETIVSCIETLNCLDIQEEIMHGSNALSEKKLIHRMNSEDRKKVENSDLEKCESYEKKTLKNAIGTSESEKALEKCESYEKETLEDTAKTSESEKAKWNTIQVKNIKNSIEDDTNTNITNDITSEKFLMKTKEPCYFVKDLSVLLTPLEHFASTPFYKISQTADTKDLDKEQKSVKANPIIVFGNKLPLKEVRIKIEKLSEAEIASYLHPDTSNLGEDKLGSQLSNSIEELTKTVVVKSSEYPDLRKINKNKAKVRKKAAAHLKKHRMIKASNVLNLGEMKLDRKSFGTAKTSTGSNKNATKCSDDQLVMCGKRKKTHQSAKCCKHKKNYNQSVEKSMSKKSNNNSTKCNKRKKSDQSVNRNKRKKIDDQLVSELSANGSKVNVFPRINMSASKKSIKECIKTESCNINSSSSKDSTSDVGKTSLSSNLPEPCVAVTNQNLSLKDRIYKQHSEDILTRVLGLYASE
ncbi:SUMO-specific isopeptidase USPL1 [Caerostris extrusa]|uniref:SUMO-specific isopeptidase USPL1 n=1 Tax=Caerostris extrusa TaxID=172846 RepID=A0AAV4MJR2_CAEEX|nr:SUMO-specific isopeptidase USPL1 [Caerostris extrusa]